MEAGTKLSKFCARFPEIFRRIIMTNINCTKKCIFQKDGLCSYDNTTVILKNLDKTNEDDKKCVYQKTGVTEK